MEIHTKKELKFYMMADRMMNRGTFKPSFCDYIKSIISPDYIIKYLRLMRLTSYYLNQNGFAKILGIYYKLKYNRIGMKLGFSIGYNCFGYGLVIPHYGTIVVGASNRIGNYAVLHTSTCISDNKKIIGDALYLSTGVKMTSQLVLGNNISIGANSLVNKSHEDGNVMLAGAPAKVIKSSEAWYTKDGSSYAKKVENVESLMIRLLKS